MFVRNGEVLGSVLNSAVPGTKPKPQKAAPPKAEPPATDETKAQDAPAPEPEPTPEPEPAKPAAKKAAPAKHTGGKP